MDIVMGLLIVAVVMIDMVHDEFEIGGIEW